MITFPTGMKKRARFIEGAIGFELGILRDARAILAMTPEELERHCELRRSQGMFFCSPEYERSESQKAIERGFTIERVRDYAADIMSEFGCVPERF